MELLQVYFNDPKIKTVFDLGCGDWRLMSAINVPDDKIYEGFDLVKSVIKDNVRSYKKSNIRFHHIHELSDFKKEKGDLLVVKDVMQHWPNEEIRYFINNILPNFKYALLTNDYSIPNFYDINNDIIHGEWRLLDLEKEPFNLKNIETILDYTAHGVLKRVYLYKNPLLSDKS